MRAIGLLLVSRPINTITEQITTAISEKLHPLTEDLTKHYDCDREFISTTTWSKLNTPNNYKH